MKNLEPKDVWNCQGKTTVLAQVDLFRLIGKSGKKTKERIPTNWHVLRRAVLTASGALGILSLHSATPRRYDTDLESVSHKD